MKNLSGLGEKNYIAHNRLPMRSLGRFAAMRLVPHSSNDMRFEEKE